MTRVSIVTISFNQSDFIEQCVKSVLAQDYADIEYIVVDAGSSDGSQEIIQAYAGQIAKMIFEPDKGPADGLNKGFAAASGDIFGYLNADDVILPDAVSRVVEAFKRHPQADVIYGHGFITDRQLRPIRRFRSGVYTPLRYAYGVGVIMQQSTFFRRDAFLSVGGFNEDNKWTWDGELILDMAMAGKKLVRIHDYLSLFRVYEGTISQSLKQMPSDYVANRKRLVKKILGRNEEPYDKVIVRLVRLHKWLSDPVSTIIRAHDAFITPKLS